MLILMLLILYACLIKMFSEYQNVYRVIHGKEKKRTILQRLHWKLERQSIQYFLMEKKF